MTRNPEFLPPRATNIEVMDIKEPILLRGEPKEFNEAREPATANQQIFLGITIAVTLSLSFLRLWTCGVAGGGGGG